MLRNFGLLGAVLLGLALSGCATAQSPEADDENDPLEGGNRPSFHVSVALDKAAARPVAVAYRGVVPRQIRGGVRNVLNNLGSIPTFANDILQGEATRAGTTLVRFVVNSTIGFGGLFEVAEDYGYPRHFEDFGQTLAVWGIGEGPYLFVPLLGPSTPRDLTGSVVDFFFDPFTYVQWGDESYVPYVRTGLVYLELRSSNIQTLDDIEASSADFYTSLRGLYRQARNNEIRNGAQEIDDLPNF